MAAELHAAIEYQRELEEKLEEAESENSKINDELVEANGKYTQAMAELQATVQKFTGKIETFTRISDMYSSAAAKANYQLEINLDDEKNTKMSKHLRLKRWVVFVQHSYSY